MLRLLFILLLFTHIVLGDRCKNLVQEVRRAHYLAFGVDFPYWYGVGQLKQESGCRDVISKDGVGSRGVAQITYRVWQKFLKKRGINNINTISNQIHAQAYIMKQCKLEAYTSHLWGAYMVYNGGHIVNKEIIRARKKYHIREVPYCIAKEFCKRKIIEFNNGQSISACKIAYDYPKKIYIYGQQYKPFNINEKEFRYIFW